MHFWSVGTTANFELWWLILFACWKDFVLLAGPSCWDIFPWPCFPFTSDFHKKKKKNATKDGLYLVWHSMMPVNTVVTVCLQFFPKWEVTLSKESHTIQRISLHLQPFSWGDTLICWYKAERKIRLICGCFFPFSSTMVVARKLCETKKCPWAVLIENTLSVWLKNN